MSTQETIAKIQTEMVEAHRKLGEAYHLLARANRMLDELRFILLIGGADENRHEKSGARTESPIPSA